MAEGNAIAPASQAELKTVADMYKYHSYSGDLNNLITPGFYTVSGDPAHAPVSGDIAWEVLVFGGSNGTNDFLLQIAVSYSGNKAYMRKSWGGWHNWISL